jgi:hypothetical protein
MRRIVTAADLPHPAPGPAHPTPRTGPVGPYRGADATAVGIGG